MLIWLASAENTSDALMSIIVSRFERCEVPSSMERETSMATTMFSSRSACVRRTNGASSLAVTFQSMRRTSSPGL